MPVETPAYWRSRSVLSWCLWPLSLMFRMLVAVRRWLYQTGVLRSWQSPVPVVVVGNLTAGGAGKTPLVIALAKHLSDQGKSVGVVTRGYGGESNSNQPVLVTGDSDTLLVGDEAVLIAQRTGVSVVAGKNRPSAIRHLIEQKNCDIVISDDGLQHYAMRRDIELLVVDQQYQFGNGFCFPAGPMREPLSRLKHIDLLVISGLHRDDQDATKRGYSLAADAFYNAATGVSIEPGSFVSELNGTVVHAVAAIAHPQKFFATLRRLGLQIIEHSFADHYVYQISDLDFDDDLPVVMTEKDLVKCRSWVSDQVWALQVSAVVDGIILDEFDQLLTVAEQRNAL